nr:hypothetical protein [Tanacetum cinerariifolium]
MNIKAFKLSNLERYEHVGPKVASAQGGKDLRMAKRYYAWLMISRHSKSHQIQVKEQAYVQKSIIITTIHKIKNKAADIDRPPLQEMSIQEIKDLKQHYLDEMLSLSNDLGIKDYRNEKIDIYFRRECEDMIDELKSKFNGMSIEINKKKELQYLEQVATLSTYSLQRFKYFCCYDDDDDEEYSIQVSEFYKNSPIAITSVLPTIEPEDSLSIGDEHLSTIPEKESDKVIKSSVENLIPIPSESKDLTDYESKCDMSICDDSSSKNEGSNDIVSIPSGKEIDHLDAIPDSV